MRFGMNLLLWTGQMHDGMLPVLEMLKRLGYDGVEIPIFDTSLNYADWGRRQLDITRKLFACLLNPALDFANIGEVLIEPAAIGNGKVVLHTTNFTHDGVQQADRQIAA